MAERRANHAGHHVVAHFSERTEAAGIVKHFHRPAIDNLACLRVVRMYHHVLIAGVAELARDVGSV